MKLYQLGAHLPTYARILRENNIKDISLNYMGLRQRTKFVKPWLLKDKFESDQNVFVDSGCYTLNSAKPEGQYKYEAKELRDIGDHYYSWISDNIDSLVLYTEFDSRQLGDGYIGERRDEFQGSMYDKVVPIWNPANGLQELDELGGRFGRVGLLSTTINGRDLVPHLNRLAAKGIDLHGLSMTKPDIMQAVKWTSVSSTSWISPQKYGDTVVWSHNKLKRYPKTMKEQGRKKERFVITAAGFDIDKIMADNPGELLNLSLWSWNKLMESINGKEVTTPVEMDTLVNMENEDDEVGDLPVKTGNKALTTRSRNPDEMRVLPLLDFSYDKEKIKNPQTGEMEDVEVPKIKTRGDSMRLCDSCFLAPKCPMFAENTTCAYDIPIVIRTKEQMTALMDSMVEMQAQRVWFMKIAEDMTGDGMDPILSSEMDRLSRLMKNKHDMEQEGFSLTVTAKQQGQANVMDSIFGSMTNKSFTALPAPVEVPDVLVDLGIQDAFIEEY